MEVERQTSKKKPPVMDRGTFLTVRGCGKIDIKSVQQDGTVKVYVCTDVDDAIFDLIDVITSKIKLVCPEAEGKEDNDG